MFVLFREYIKFELLFVEKLRARQKVLSLEKDGKVTQVEEKNVDDDEKEDEESDDGSEDEIEKLEKEKKKKEKKERKDKMKDEVDDKILNFGLVNLVLEVLNIIIIIQPSLKVPCPVDYVTLNSRVGLLIIYPVCMGFSLYKVVSSRNFLFVQAALVSIPEPEFAVSLLVTVRQFPGTLPVQQNILNILEHTFSQHPVSLDTKARMCLEKVNNIYLCNFFWPEFFVCLRFKNIFNHERSKGLKILSLNRKQIKKY